MIRFIVCGPPCAGKSTFVRDHSASGDLIWDYDLIHQALSGQDDHDHLSEIRPFVIAAREAIFNQLEAHQSQRAWIITSSSKQSEIQSLSDRFGAEIIYLEISQEEAHLRARADQRPEIWHDYIENWFQNSDLELKGWHNMSKKTYKAHFEFKQDGEPGEFIAKFAKLNVIDLDGDVTVPGAFHQGQEVIIEPWNHSWDLPAGKGVIQSDEEWAWVDGKFILETQVGKENYLTVKELGPLAEWSYTFNVLEADPGNFQGERVQFLKDLDTIGVSPVTRGAGIETHTVSIKNKSESDQDPGESDKGEVQKDKLRKQLLLEIDLLDIQINTIGELR